MNKFDIKINKLLERYIFIDSKDYDGDGKIESPEDEYKGSKDKAIKKAMGKDEDEQTTTPTKPITEPDTEEKEKKKRNPLRPQPGKKPKPMARDTQKFINRRK